MHMHFTLVHIFNRTSDNFIMEAYSMGCFHQQTELGLYLVTLSGSIRDIA